MRRVEHVCNDVVHGVNANYNDKFAKRKVSLSLLVLKQVIM